MLILRRRQGEAISIGPGIEIEILEIGPSKVKIGIHAPNEVMVQRKEVLVAGEHNRRAASMSFETRSELGKNLGQHFSSIQAKTNWQAVDKPFEARYFGHPLKAENLKPA